MIKIVSLVYFNSLTTFLFFILSFFSDKIMAIKRNVDGRTYFGYSCTQMIYAEICFVSDLLKLHHLDKILKHLFKMWIDSLKNAMLRGENEH